VEITSAAPLVKGIVERWGRVFFASAGRFLSKKEIYAPQGSTGAVLTSYGLWAANSAPRDSAVSFRGGLHMRTIIQTKAAITILLLLLPSPARAQDYGAVGKAQDFLENQERVKAMLFFAHPEAQYQSVKAKPRTLVSDGRGGVVSGHFALTYTYSWKSPFSGDNNTTDLIFFFDQNGRIYAVDGGPTTSTFRPFTAADVVINASREQILKDVDRTGTEAEKRLVRALIQSGDARSLLAALLKMAQPR
jgi:hypothetical protein